MQVFEKFGVYLCLLSIFLCKSVGAQNAPLPNAAMGQGLYEQTAANSCMHCHGVGGHDGKVAVAANLTKPKTWRTYKGLGGDAALAKNSKEFIDNMEDALIDLIKNGAAKHNGAYKKPFFDYTKAGGTYNAQMVGLGGSPSQAWLKKYASRKVTPDIAAHSAFLYIKTLDTQGVFK